MLNQREFNKFGKENSSKDIINEYKFITVLTILIFSLANSFYLSDLREFALSILTSILLYFSAVHGRYILPALAIPFITLFLGFFQEGSNYFLILANMICLNVIYFHEKLYNILNTWDKHHLYSYNESVRQMALEAQKNSIINNANADHKEELISMTFSFVIQHSLHIFLPGLGFFITPLIRGTIFRRQELFESPIDIKTRRDVVRVKSLSSIIFTLPFIIVVIYIIIVVLSQSFEVFKGNSWISYSFHILNNFSKSYIK